MFLKLMYITNHPAIAFIADKYFVDRIFIDLEKNGKEKRQPQMNTVKSNHHLSDINIIKNVVTSSQVLVRVNPLFEGSKQEIDEAIDRGADIIMLPMFRTYDDVEKFRDYVNGRAKTLLLLETRDAENSLDKILTLSGIDEIHIGLNDLHIDYKLKFMFELLSNGTVETIAKKISATGIPFGFGGIARLNSGLISGKNIIAEHYRLGSQMAILSRSFCNTELIHDLSIIDNTFRIGIHEIRNYEKEIQKQDSSFFLENKAYVNSKVIDVINKIKTKVHAS